MLYSSAFRRLNGITQVAPADEIALFHNRMTHSLKVGQVGRKIAATINYLAAESDDVKDACRKFAGLPWSASTDSAIDPWILETAGMAHDLGHPPFGHIAEHALQKAVSTKPNEGERLKVPEGAALPDSFEGNAQSFRIVTKLSFGRIASAPERGSDAPQVVGLNLTQASLSALQKYPWRFMERPPGIDQRKLKWGAYDTERLILDWVTASLPAHTEYRERPDGSRELRSLTAQAMDWADDITYAVHDVEDFCRAGLIPADLLREGRTGNAPAEAVWQYCAPKIMEDPQIRAKLPGSDTAAQDELRRIFDATVRLIPSMSELTRSSREKVRTWSSGLIDSYTSPGKDGILLDAPSGTLDIAVSPLIQVEILKKLTWYFVIERSSLGAAQRGQARVIRELFVWLWDWVKESYSLQYQTPNLARTEYHLDGLPARLIDVLDIAFWDFESGFGYKTRDECVSRGVCDYIASLSERQAVELHGRLNGTSHRGSFDESFQY